MHSIFDIVYYIVNPEGLLKYIVETLQLFAYKLLSFACKGMNVLKTSNRAIRPPFGNNVSCPLEWEKRKTANLKTVLGIVKCELY